MSELVPFITIGLVSGALYGLAGIGLVLTYRTSGIFNLGHGAIAAASAFVFYSLWLDHGVPWPIAGVVTVVLFGLVVGTILDLVTRGLAQGSEVVVVVATVGIMVGVQGVLYATYGNVTRYAPFFLPESGFVVTGVKISWAQVISFGIAAVATVLLYWFLQRTRTGAAMRAVVENPQLVVLVGEDADRIRRIGWMLGATTAAVSGILLAPLLNLDPQVLTFLVVQAFGACALGLFKSLPGTFVGGLCVGLVAAFTIKYATGAAFVGLPSAVPFIVLVVVLLVVPARYFPASSRSLVALSRRAAVSTKTRVVSAGVGLPVVLVLPFVVGTKLPVWTAAISSVLVFASLSFLTWGSGQISLCHAAFLALGTSTMGNLTHSGVPWGLALVVSGLAVMPLGALVALPAIRLSGIYLALATLGLGMFLQGVMFQTDFMFSSDLATTIPRPHLGGFDGSNDRALYFLTLAIVAVCVTVLLACQRGRFGRMLAAMAEVPSVLSTSGLRLTVTRLLVVCISAFFAGIAGALANTLSTAASAITFSPVQSLLFVAVLGVCGTRRLVSPVLAALLLSVLPGYVTSFGLNESMLVFGAVAIIGALRLANAKWLDDWFAAAAVRTEGRRRHGPLARPRRPTEHGPLVEPA